MKVKLRVRLKVTVQKGCCNQDLLYSVESKKGHRVAVCQVCRQYYVRQREVENL